VDKELTNVRTEDYNFFNRKGIWIGVKAYRHRPFWYIVEDYLKMQEDYDEMYGVGELAKMVDEEMAQRFDSALMKFRVTIMMTKSDTRKDWKELEQRKEVCKRGLIAMDKYVRDNNIYEPPEMWVDTRLGFTTAIVKDASKLLQAKAVRKDINVFYTFDEIIELTRGSDVNSVKQQLDSVGIKDTQVVEVKQEDEEYYNDKVPF
jgi:hypothetical protein